MVRLFLALSAIFLVLSIWFSWSVVDTALEYRDKKEEFASLLNFRERFLDPDEWLGGEEAAEKLSLAAVQQQEFSWLQDRFRKQAWGLAALGGGYLLCLFLFYYRRADYRLFAAGLMLAALACLPVGLRAPMLEISALEHNLDLGRLPIQTRVLGMEVKVQLEQRFPGEMYFYYQSKSVVELIQLLFRQQNWIVGISILAFSILFPLLKVCLSLACLLVPRWYERRGLRWFLEYGGKWSMADVFVVAVFLAFLAFSNMQVGIPTESRVLVGLYFFLGYCLLSLLAGYWLGRFKASRSAAAAGI